jgi:cholinesterase
VTLVPISKLPSQHIWLPRPPGLPQTVGLQDQRLAIEWVRDNIVAFGDDADRITMVGQRAGAASADIYSYA